MFLSPILSLLEPICQLFTSKKIDRHIDVFILLLAKIDIFVIGNNTQDGWLYFLLRNVLQKSTLFCWQPPCQDFLGKKLKEKVFANKVEKHEYSLMTNYVFLKAQIDFFRSTKHFYFFNQVCTDKSYLDLLYSLYG